MRTLDCGCGLRTVADSPIGHVGTPTLGCDIVYCPVHAAAPELLEALKKVMENNPYHNTRVGLAEAWEEIQDVAQAAIDQAKEVMHVGQGYRLQL